MRSFPKLLNEVIIDDFHHHLENEKTLLLEEKQENLSTTFNILPNERNNISCFQFDKPPISGNDVVFPFFSQKSGLRTKNDFTLIHQKGSLVYIFLIELKSKNKSNYLSQLRSGKLLIEFIIAKIRLASKDWNDFNLQEFEKLQFNYKAIRFCIQEADAETTTHARKTKFKETTKHKKLESKKLDEFDVYHLPYDAIYYLSQFI
jgi:hypothetical protein